MSQMTAGQSFGRYRIIEQLGAGGMGVVYRARDERLQRDVALKILPAGRHQRETSRRRLRQEALALSKLNHPHIATVYDFDSHDGVEFVVMEYIAGATLDDRLNSGPLPEEDALAISEQVADALEAAHEQGLTHRDLKPGNIVVTPKGQVKVVDFGLAQVLQPDLEQLLTQSAAEPQPDPYAGTLPYMAPEQLRGEETDHRSDIWAAGAVLYEMVTGQRAFPDAHTPVLIDHIFNRPPTLPRDLNANLSHDVESIILKALEKNPDHRYQSARDFRVDHLRLRHASIPANRDSSFSLTSSRARWTPAPKGVRRRMTFITMAVIAVVLAGAGIWWRIHSRNAGGVALKRPLVLIGDFENRTGDPIFDQTLREMLTTSLGQSHVVGLYPASRVSDALKRMEHPGNTPIGEQLGVELCQREGLQAVVLGSISRIGESYVIGVRAVAANTETLLRSQAQVQKPDQVPPALDKLVRELRATMGELPAAMQGTSAPLAQVTSGSLQAVRYYTLGKERLYAGDPLEAVALFHKAAELDAGFAMAHDYLGIAYYQLNDPLRAEKHHYDASLLVSKVTESERLKILGDYTHVSGDFDAAIGYYQALLELHPDDPAPLVNLAICYVDRLDFAAAVNATQRAVNLAPNSRVRLNLSEQLAKKGDSAKAMQILQEVRRSLPDDIRAMRDYANLLVLRGQLAEARRVYEGMIRAGGEKEAVGRSYLADLDLATGRYREARAQLEGAILAADSRGYRFAAWKDRVTLAESAAAVPGSQAQPAALRGADPPQSPVLLFLTGRYYARRHRLNEAQKVLKMSETLAAKRPGATAQSFRLLLRAEIALGQGDTAAAIEAAESGVRYLHSTLALEVEGDAYAAAGRDRDAVNVYEQIFQRAVERAYSYGYDDPAFHRLADLHYRTGVLYQKLGDAANARKHLRTFFDLGSEADPGLASGVVHKYRYIQITLCQWYGRFCPLR